MIYNILFPVLNEELRLSSGINRTIEYIHNELPDKEVFLTIIDNGSTDRTQQISKELCHKFPEILQYQRVEEKGVGIAFRTGVGFTTADIVGYMDIDLSTDLNHLKDMINIFESRPNIEIVNGSRYSRDSQLVGRKWYRNLVSYILIYILKAVFQMKATDAICGFKFFKRETAKKLIDLSSNENGWFYLIELLLRAEKLRIPIYEMPVKWVFEKNTKVRIWKVTKNYLCQIWKLYWKLRTFK